MNSMLIGVILCILTVFHVLWTPCTKGSMLTGFLCAGLHACQVLVCRAPCLPGSICSQFLCDESHDCRVPVGFHVYQAPWLSGSIYSGFFCASFLHSGFHLLWIPCTPGSMHAGFHVCLAPTTPDSNHAGSMLTGFYVLWIIVCCIVPRVLRLVNSCVPDSMHAGFYVLWILVCRVLCMPDYKYMLLVNVISIAGHIY